MAINHWCPTIGIANFNVEEEDDFMQDGRDGSLEQERDAL